MSRSATKPGPRVELVVCADDFGLSEAVNEAVIELARKRRLSAVGVLVDGAAVTNWVSLLRTVGVDIGLHLNFTEPLGAPGPVHPLPALIARAYTGLLDPAAVRRSIEAQLDRFEALVDAAPDYVDGHQHVHQLPVIGDALLIALTRRYGCRPWVRCTTRASTRSPWRSGRDDRKAWVVDRLGGASFRRAADRLGFAANARLLGVYDFDDGRLPYPQRVGRWLDQARDGDVLVCHPATYRLRMDPISGCRVREREFLASDAFEQALRDRSIDITRLSRVAAEATAPVDDLATNDSRETRR